MTTKLVWHRRPRRWSFWQFRCVLCGKTVLLFHSGDDVAPGKPGFGFLGWDDARSRRSLLCVPSCPLWL